jgi:hypothetical protein
VLGRCTTPAPPPRKAHAMEGNLFQLVELPSALERGGRPLRAFAAYFTSGGAGQQDMILKQPVQLDAQFALRRVSMKVARAQTIQCDVGGDEHAPPRLDACCIPACGTYLDLLDQLIGAPTSDWPIHLPPTATSIRFAPQAGERTVQTLNVPPALRALGEASAPQLYMLLLVI